MFLGVVFSYDNAQTQRALHRRCTCSQCSEWSSGGTEKEFFEEHALHQYFLYVWEEELFVPQEVSSAEKMFPTGEPTSAPLLFGPNEPSPFQLAAVS